MKIRTKLILFLFLIILGFIGALITQTLLEKRRLNLLFIERKIRESAIFDKLLESKTASLSTLAYDYTYWDEMVDFIQTEKLSWARKVLDESVLSNFKTNAIWVYKIDLSLAYSINNLKDDNFKDMPLVPKEMIKKLFLKESFSHFFMDTPKGLMEVRGATIHPTADVKRETEPQGYFFTGRLWDEKFIGELAKLIGGRIAITPITQEELRSDVNLGLISFSRLLSAWDKSPLMRLNVQMETKIIRYFHQTHRQQFFLLSILMCIFLIFVSIVTTFLITAPLRQICQSLNTQDTTYLNKLEKDKSEFGDISQLIHKFFDQKKNLESAYVQLKSAQAQLVQSAKMASVGQLASGLAHEINSPLTGVLNNIQLVRRQIEQQKPLSLDYFRETLVNVEESAGRCRDIVRSLLDFSRTSNNQFNLVSLNEIAEKAIGLLGHNLGLEKISLQRHLQSDLPQILGDAQHLQQVVVNIISNSIWAIGQAKKPEGLITVKTESLPEKKAILLSISDNGIGIPKENLDKIFEPFFTTKPVGEGTGLGLGIVYGIIKEHKGSIEVESLVGKETAFKILLPYTLEA